MDRITATLRLSRLPGYLVIITIILSILPLLLNLFGVSFATTEQLVNLQELAGLSQVELADQLHLALESSFIHTVLEWSVVCIALLTIILAFIHYLLTKDVAIPLLAMVLFWAGLMDAFHILAADRIIDTSVDNTALILFSWAVARLFTAIFLAAGALLLLIRLWVLRERESMMGGASFLIAFGSLFGIVAIALIFLSTFSGFVPTTVFPDLALKRPYDVAPIVVYVVAGLLVFPALYRRNPGVFTHSLIICVLPLIAAQLHIAFGSTELYDNHFNIAHALKVVAYLILFLGLSIDFIRVYRRQKMTSEQLEQDVKIRKQVEEQLRDNERAMASSLKMAGNVQRSMLPGSAELEHLFQATGWKIAYYNAPCQHLGGDIFGMKFVQPDFVLLYVADISGHGIPAALAAIGLTTHFSNMLETTAEPLAVFESANEFCCKQLPEEIYATMVYLKINVKTGRVECINGGHQSVFLLDPNNQIFEYPSSAPALGLFQDASENAEYMRLEMRSNCRMVLFSDGVTEMRNSQQEFFGVERLVSEFAQSARFGPEGTISRLQDKLDDWRGVHIPLEDDVTIATLQWKQTD